MQSREARAGWAVGCDLGGTTLRVLARDATGRMFNMVRFPVISVTSELDVTFRWKILFQEASAAS